MNNNISDLDSALLFAGWKRAENNSNLPSNNQQQEIKKSEFSKIIERSLSQLKTNYDTNAREKAATKLKELANRRIEQKENNFSAIHKFFHRIGQLFQGHGFRTKGEWELELASRVKKIDLEILKDQIRACISPNKNVKITKNSDEKLLADEKNTINKLPRQDFEELINDVIFKTKDSKSTEIQDRRGLTYKAIKHKLIFYNNLNDEKRKIFDETLTKRNDWFTQALDITALTHPEDNKEFFSGKIIDKFLSEPEQAIKENQRLYNGKSDKLLERLLLESTKKLLDKNSSEELYSLYQHFRKNKDNTPFMFFSGAKSSLSSEQFDKIKNMSTLKEGFYKYSL